ncbi:uncharacterized protein LOC116927213 isoform X2 [Daphnia magna]|uniref:uncharacterized protein LOC116927213 isoform X2 n=1 Tax=Daphnia magna TaxID=35525 RepID=UPI001E1BDD7D|nr:uncharacterized protein LOC116927213 isoform X2 [Daphnia magna]
MIDIIFFCSRIVWLHNWNFLMYNFLVFTMWKNRTSPNRRQNKAFKIQTALSHPLFEPYWSAGKKSAIIVLINQWHKTMVSAFFPRKQDHILPNKWHSQSVEDSLQPARFTSSYFPLVLECDTST